MSDAIRIYVACLASYNNGRLHGAWIDCDGQSADELQAAVNAMLRASPYPNVTRRQCADCEHIQDARAGDDECDECGGALGEPFPSAEEWAIHDHEGFAGLIGESTSFSDVADIAEALADDDKRVGLIWLMRDCGADLAEALRLCDDVRTFQSDAHDLAAEYAADLVADAYSDALESLPDFIRNRIDYEGIGRDLLLGGDVATFELDGERYLITNANEF